MEDPSAAPKHHRRSIRLPGYDYTQAGAYFITLVTEDRACLLGDIRNGDMLLNQAGLLADREWHSLTRRFPGLELDAFQVMPNHLHAILLLTDPCNAGSKTGTSDPPPFGGKVQPGSVPAIVRAYKSAVALRYKRMNLPDHGPLWQRNYYEHIIRSTESLDRIRAYILNNPQQWAEDQENPAR